MNREDFNILSSNIIYFDNAATSLKPKSVIDAMNDYYNNYPANIHRGDYDISLKASDKYEEAREEVAKFINADKDNVVFTSGTTDSLNKIIFGYFDNLLTLEDDVLTTKAEHASLILPLFNTKANIKYIPLDNNYHLTVDNVIKSITPNTKVIALSYVTNVVGDIRDIKTIIKYAHERNILVIVDAAQAVSHIKIDVKDLDVDFLAFSAHKMLGPTGVGVLYGKKELLEDTLPIIYGGDMNANFTSDREVTYNSLPSRLEAGTPNIAGVIGFTEAIKYINKLNNVLEYEKDLRDYLISKLKTNPNITIYNEVSDTGIVIFNYNNIFSQDLAVYLDKYNICVRAGSHCTKLFVDELGVKNTVRISLSFYNTKEEIDRLIEVLNNPNIDKEII